MPSIRNDASIVVHTKQMLVSLMERYMAANKLSQRKLAEKIAVDESIISKILSGELEKFSVERLMKYTSDLYPSLAVKVWAKERISDNL